MKFTFTCNDDTSTVSHIVNYEILSDVVNAFSCFLLGCGFVFNGELQIVEEDEDTDNMHWSEDTSNDALEQEMPINNVLNLVVAACEARAIKDEFLPHIVDALVEAGCEVDV